LQRRGSGFIRSKPHRLKAQHSGRKPEENSPPKKTEKEEKKRI